ncbi:MAG: AmmeMemoRadiSam system protein A [Patescibacteria group bacterium]|nr:AmmeMemoRadiSam system protein A [Patescibacteria group bacterium]MDD4610920.1 AmmeMemoRadiSam system protein A [Patescibacteria group bacterium]
MLTQSQKNQLLKIARESVEAYVKEGKTLNFKIEDEILNEERGAFVTLHEHGELRGCIGIIEAHGRSLWRMVRDMAIAAASEDYRFDPVEEKELENLEYEISVLTVPQKIKNWREIKLGKQGVIIKRKFQSGVFLPQVAEETGWSLKEFLAHLCADKAGLESDSYKNDPEIELYVFEAEVF